MTDVFVRIISCFRFEICMLLSATIAINQYLKENLSSVLQQLVNLFVNKYFALKFDCDFTLKIFLLLNFIEFYSCEKKMNS